MPGDDGIRTRALTKADETSAVIHWAKPSAMLYVQKRIRYGAAIRSIDFVERR